MRSSSWRARRIYASYPSCHRFLSPKPPLSLKFLLIYHPPPNFSIPSPSPVSPPRFPHDLPIHLVELSFNLRFLFFFYTSASFSGNDSTDVTASHHLRPTSFHLHPVVSVSVGKSVVASSSKASEHRRRPLDNLYLRTTIRTSLEPLLPLSRRRLQDRQMHTVHSLVLPHLPSIHYLIRNGPSFRSNRGALHRSFPRLPSSLRIARG